MGKYKRRVEIAKIERQLYKERGFKVKALGLLTNPLALSVLLPTTLYMVPVAAIGILTVTTLAKWLWHKGIKGKGREELGKAGVPKGDEKFFKLFVTESDWLGHLIVHRMAVKKYEKDELKAKRKKEAEEKRIKDILDKKGKKGEPGDEEPGDEEPGDKEPGDE